MGLELGPILTLSKSKMAGSEFDIITIASSQCKALFGLFSLKKQQKLFVIQLF